jgi:hypothetical protein
MAIVSSHIITREDKSFGQWVNIHRQRNSHAKNKMRQDRKEVLDEIKFVWHVAASGADVQSSDKIWPVYKQDKAFGRWVPK